MADGSGPGRRRARAPDGRSSWRSRRRPTPSWARSPSRSRCRSGAAAGARTRAQWAWGADYSPEKADEARREREREQLEQGLEKSRTGFGARLRGAFGARVETDWDEVEETLITGDVGAALSMDLVERARKRRDLEGEDAVRAELAALLAPRDASHWEPVPAAEGAPAIVLVVGVNGTGKTTTIGKLAAREHANGRRVVLAAADTFRAAAIDQLRIWAQRTGSEVVAHAPNADPGGRRVRRPRRRHRAPRRHPHRRHRRPAAHEVEPDGGAAPRCAG